MKTLYYSFFTLKKNYIKKKPINTIDTNLSLQTFDNLSSFCLARSENSNVPTKLPLPSCDSASSNLSAMSNICPVV
jgi:hypothetical protein